MTLCGSNPGFTDISRRKLLTSSPAPRRQDIQQQAVERDERKQNKEAPETGRHRLHAHVDQERWILLPAAAELEWRDDAREKIQHENERSRKNEDCPEPGDENLFRLDGQTCERQVIAPAREKRLPLKSMRSDR